MNKNKDGVIEIDLMQMFRAILNRLWVVILAAVLGGTIAFGYTTFFIPYTYESSALVYVNNQALSVGSAKLSISSSELTASQNLVNTYIVILTSRNTLNDVISEAGLNMSYDSLKDKIKAAAENNTEVFKITVTDTDPLRAELIVNTICKVLPDKIADIVEGSSARIVDYGVVPGQRSAPSRTKNTLIGVIIAVVLACAVIVVAELMDKVIRSEQYPTQTYPKIPILASIPDMEKSESGSSYYSYKKNRYGYGYGYGNTTKQAGKEDK